MGVKLSNDNTGLATVISSTPIIVFGGISKFGYVRATATEVFLKGKNISSPIVLEGAIQTLTNDLATTALMQQSKNNEMSLPAKMAMGLFFRAYLRLLPTSLLPAMLRTAAYPPLKPPPSGVVSYDSCPKEYPVSEALVKFSAALQTSGEAKYTDDFTASIAGGCVHVSHVLAEYANARIQSMDWSAALALDSSIQVVDSSTLLGNGMMNGYSDDEPYLLSAGDRVSYYGQVIALVIGKSRSLSRKAAKLVHVRYDDIQKPILSIDDAIAAESYFPSDPQAASLSQGNFNEALADADTVVSGWVECGSQYHFYMETQTSLALPQEGGDIIIKASTQSPTSIQGAVAKALQMSSNRITVEMKRGGGGYGGKGERSIPPAVHAAVAASLTRKPASCVLDINTNMLAVGSRRPHKAHFRAAVKGGFIRGLELDVYNMQGAFTDMGDTPALIVAPAIDGVYSISNWDVHGKCCRTNTAANTSCRGPAWLPGK